MKKTFKIKKSDIISVTGAGGKTSLILALANELKSYGPVLVTSSTKMRLSESQVDYLYVDSKEFRFKQKYSSYGVFAGLTPEGKQKSLSQNEILSLKENFDYTLIEADGSRMKHFKFWKDHEPVIYPVTSLVIGVLSIKLLGQKITMDNVYNHEDYKKYNHSNLIDKDLIAKLVDDPKTYFKGHEGRKILFINQVETQVEKEKALELIRDLKEKSKKKDLEYIYGSVKEGKYYED